MPWRLADLRALLCGVARPQDRTTVGHPALTGTALATYAALGHSIPAPAALDSRLELLVAHLAAVRSGCRWCIARTDHRSRRAFVPAALIEAMERHQTSSLFSERDRAALALVEAVVCYSERSRTAAEAVLAGARRYFTDAEVTSILRIATEEHFYNPATGALGRDAGSMMLSSESRSGGWTESEPPAQGTSR